MRILLIEDDPTTARSIELMLSHANFNVYLTDMGEEGVDLERHDQDEQEGDRGGGQQQQAAGQQQVGHFDRARLGRAVRRLFGRAHRRDLVDAEHRADQDQRADQQRKDGGAQ